MAAESQDHKSVFRMNKFTMLVVIAAIMSVMIAACTGTSEPPEPTPTFPVSTTTPTMTPDVTAEPTQEPEETPTQGETPTAEPTQGAAATATSEPTQEPEETPIPTMEPTQEPVATSTPEVTPIIPEPPPLPAVSFEILSPWFGAEVDTDFVTVWVTLDYDEPGSVSFVTINGEPANMLGEDAAYLNVSLEEGENLISITAVDPFGGMVSDSVTVTYIPPADGTLPLAVFYPPDALTVFDTQVMVIGGTSPDAIVTVNGETVSVDADGMFMTIADLEANDYIIDVTSTATNDDGQTLTIVESLQLVQFGAEQTPTPPAPTATPEPEVTPEPPTPTATSEPEVTPTPPAPTVTPEPEETPELTTLNVLSPTDEAEIETPVITVLLQVLDEMIVRVNGDLVEVSDDGVAETELTLTEGENTIVIAANNFSLGISETAVFTVHYVPPTSFDALPFTIFYPFDGAVTNDSQIRVIGATIDDATVEVDGEIVDVSDSGTFTATVNLRAGENEIDIMAVDDRFEDIERMETIVVTYIPEP